MLDLDDVGDGATAIDRIQARIDELARSDSDKLLPILRDQKSLPELRHLLESLDLTQRMDFLRRLVTGPLSGRLTVAEAFLDWEGGTNRAELNEIVREDLCRRILAPERLERLARACEELAAP